MARQKVRLAARKGTASPNQQPRAEIATCAAVRTFPRDDPQAAEYEMGHLIFLDHYSIGFRSVERFLVERPDRRASNLAGVAAGGFRSSLDSI